MALIELTENGLYCPQAQVYIDPWRPVNKALITHAHSDHARFGHQSYLAHHHSIPLLQKRLGNQHYSGIEYGETININGVNCSFHPAGHVLGSAQIKLSYKGEEWCISGDYKLQLDSVSAPFEPVKCHTFITESTFGLPVFNWRDPSIVFEEINEWWQQQATLKRTAIIFAYSLGKAQRILQGINHDIGTVWVHNAVHELNEAHLQTGVQLKAWNVLNPNTKPQPGDLIIAPTSAETDGWLKRFEPYATASASGWMAIRGTRRRSSADRGFVLSDHADWNGLNTAIKATECESVWVTHGYAATFSKWLREQGLNAIDIQTPFTDQPETDLPTQVSL